MSFNFGGTSKKKSSKKGKKAPILKEDQVSENTTKLQKLKEQDKIAAKRMEDKLETHFYACLVFQSWEQKIEFLEACHDVLAVDDVFIDGESFAKKFNIKITPCNFDIIHSHLHKRLVALARIKDHENKRDSVYKPDDVSFG